MNGMQASWRDVRTPISHRAQECTVKAFCAARSTRRNLSAGAGSYPWPSGACSTSNWLPFGNSTTKSNHDSALTIEKQPCRTHLPPRSLSSRSGTSVSAPSASGPRSDVVDIGRPFEFHTTASLASSTTQASTNTSSSSSHDQLQPGGCSDAGGKGSHWRTAGVSDMQTVPSAKEQHETDEDGRSKRLQAALARLLTKEGAKAVPAARVEPMPTDETAAAPAPASAPAARRPAPEQLPRHRQPSPQQQPSLQQHANRTSVPNGKSDRPARPQEQTWTGPSSRRPAPLPGARSPSPIPSPHSPIIMPSGPSWYPLRQRFHPCPNKPQLPHLSCIVLVEGPTDCLQVQRAVNVAAYAIGGSGIMTKKAAEELQQLATWAVGSMGRDLVILTDPDREGNVLRDRVETLLASKAKHAFIPAAAATSTSANSRHEAGNLGVEHASTSAISQSLQGARPSYGPDRHEFSVEQLMELGLVNSFHTKEVVGAKLQRAMLCSALGIGLTCGTSLVKILNRYFSREQFEQALADTKA